MHIHIEICGVHLEIKITTGNTFVFFSLSQARERKNNQGMKFLAAFIAVCLSLSLISCETEPDEFDDGVTVEEENVSYSDKAKDSLITHLFQCF
jgi:hypothetical protein